MNLRTFFTPTYATAHERRRDLWAGVIGWFGLNLALVIAVLAGWLPSVTLTFQLLANVVVIAVFGYTRRYVAYGALWAFFCALIATLIDAPVGTVACFASMGSGCSGAFGCNSPFVFGYGFGFLVGLIPAYFILRRVHRDLGK